MALLRTFKCGPGELGKFLARIKEMGAVVTGDETSGELVGDTFLGRFEGTYVLENDQLTLTITKKPAMVPDSMLEKQLDKMASEHGVD